MALQETPPNGRSPPPVRAENFGSVSELPAVRAPHDHQAGGAGAVRVQSRRRDLRLREMRNGSEAHRDASLSGAHLI